MKNRTWLTNLCCVMILAMVVVAFTGCSKAPRDHWWQVWRTSKPQMRPEMLVVPEGEIPPPSIIESEIGDIELLPIVEIPPYPEPETIPETPPLRVEPKGVISQLLTVHFEFDKSQLTGEARMILDGNVKWILENPGVHIRIEGHCDERGTAEYNMNLGQRRSNSVRSYLIQKGVDPATLHTISYGEERPVNPNHNEEAWGQNRRAQFFVY